MRLAEPKQTTVRALAGLALMFFAFQALTLHAACACGHCNQKLATTPHHVAASPVADHACCHHKDVPKTSKGPMVHAAGCDCGDEAERVPVIVTDAKASAAIVPLAVDLTVVPLDLVSMPMSAETLAWQQATGPPGSPTRLFLQFHALLI